MLSEIRRNILIIVLVSWTNVFRYVYQVCGIIGAYRYVIIFSIFSFVNSMFKPSTLRQRLSEFIISLTRHIISSAKDCQFCLLFIVVLHRFIIVVEVVEFYFFAEILVSFSKAIVIPNWFALFCIDVKSKTKSNFIIVIKNLFAGIVTISFSRRFFLAIVH